MLARGASAAPRKRLVEGLQGQGAKWREEKERGAAHRRERRGASSALRQQSESLKPKFVKLPARKASDR